MGTNRHRQRPTMLFLLCLTTIAFGPAVKTEETCQSFECATLAARMAIMMNLSADPCEDFYNYACGNYPRMVPLDARRVPNHERVGACLYEDQLSQTAARVENQLYELLVIEKLATDTDLDIQDLYNLTRLFFMSCTQYIGNIDFAEIDAQTVQAIQLVNGLLSHLMQTIKPKTNSGGSPQQIEAIMAAIVRSGGAGLITVRLPEGFAREAFRKNSDLTNLSVASIGMSERQWSTAEVAWHRKFAYFLNTSSIARALDLDAASRAQETIIREMQRTLRASFPSKCSMHVNASSKYTVAQLDALSECAYPRSSFSWNVFFNELFGSPVDPGTIVEAKNVLSIISAMSYFKNQSVFQDRVGEKFGTHVSYLIYDWLVSFGNYLSENLRESWESVEDNRVMHDIDLVMFRPKDGRIQGCAELTKSLLRPVVERMYRSAYHPSGFNNIDDMLGLVKTAMAESVRKQSWISKGSQDLLIAKISDILHSTGLDEMTAHQLKSLYSSTLTAFRAANVTMRAIEEQDFGNLLAIALRASVHKNIQIMIGKLPVTVFSLTSPMQISSFYTKLIRFNRIILPMVLLEPPVYHVSYPGYIKLGNIGFTIAHDIGHVLNLFRIAVGRPLWDSETEAGYIERVNCVRNCCGNYTRYQGGTYRYKSDRTLDNDIWDVIGIKAAFDALQVLKRLSPPGSGQAKMMKLPYLPINQSQEQLFFIHAAQGMCNREERSEHIPSFCTADFSHSPNQLRVTSMMRNSREFAQTFCCKLGQGMLPLRDWCTFW